MKKGVPCILLLLLTGGFLFGDAPRPVRFFVQPRLYTSIIWGKSLSPGLSGAGLYSSARFSLKDTITAGPFLELRISDLGSEVFGGAEGQFRVLTVSGIAFHLHTTAGAGLALFHNAAVAVLRSGAGLSLEVPLPAWAPRVLYAGGMFTCSPNYIIPGYVRLEGVLSLSWGLP